MNCDLCGGTALLAIADSVRDYKAGRTRVSWCHECQAGDTWQEAGLE